MIGRTVRSTAAGDLEAKLAARLAANREDGAWRTERKSWTKEGEDLDFRAWNRLGGERRKWTARGVSRALLYAPPVAGEDYSIARLKAEARKEKGTSFDDHVWFDFRRFPYQPEEEWWPLLKSLQDEGMVRLPFPKVVFVFHHSRNGFSSDTLFSLKDRRDPPANEFSAELGEGIYASPQLGRGDYRPDTLVYFAFVVLASRTRKLVERDLEGAPVDAARTPTQRRDSTRRYHSVEITDELARYLSSAEKTGKASPRLHWRRGHDRKLPSGRRVWVRHCLVGLAEGLAERRDYHVAKRIAG